MLRDLASNVEATLTYLNEESGRSLHTPQRREYLISNAELASSLAEIVDSYIEYGRTKERLDALTDKLEIVEEKS